MIAKVSKGTVMDQVYLSKKRKDLPVGSYVLIQPISKPQKKSLHFVGIGKLEPSKLEMVNRIVNFYQDTWIIVSGSFLSPGYGFNDIDVIVVDGKKKNVKSLEKELGTTIHEFHLKQNQFVRASTQYPVYISMLSRCVSTKRFIKQKPTIKRQLLDVLLIPSKRFKEDFEFLSGSQIYWHLRNIAAIHRLLLGKSLHSDLLKRNIEERFKIPSSHIKLKIIDNSFANKYIGWFNEVEKLL